MSLSQRLTELISACFTGLWVQSFERHDALEEIAQMCRQENWRLSVWDIEKGLRVPSQGNAQAIDTGGNDPLAAIRSINALASADSSAVLVLVNFHRFLQSAEIVQALEHQINAGKQNRTFIIVLAPVVQLPCELERAFCVVEHDLPDRPQLEAIARGIATQDGELPAGDDLQALLDAASGMTRCEVENAYALSLVRHRRLEASTIWQLKAAELKKSNLLTLHRGGETFANLGGLEALKAFCVRALRPKSADKPKARGIVLVGPPGVGKVRSGQGPGQRNGPPHANPRSRHIDGLPGRSDRGANPANPADHRCLRSVCSGHR